MIPQEPEIAQPHPASYAELSPATLDMELGDIPMPSVQVEGEFIKIFSFLIVF
jgi:hypothetical protein